MPRLVIRSAAVMAALTLSACGSGGHNTPDDPERGAAGPDSLSTGTATHNTAPPPHTINPGAGSAPGASDGGGAQDGAGQAGAPGQGTQGGAAAPVSVDSAP